MKLKTGLLAGVLFFSGCAEFNENLHDFVQFTKNKNNSSSSTYTTIKQSEESTVANVDVDTAAARLKRYYRFKSEQEISQLNDGTSYGELVAAVSKDDYYVWTAQPNSYYKMGRVVRDNLALNLEIVKDGNNRSKIYIHMWIDEGIMTPRQVTQEVKAVAEGKK